MARISKSNRRYRTKSEIAHDVAFVLNAPLTFGTKFAVLRDLAWVWTEFHGKVKGCPYWTKMALMQHRVDAKVKLLHEHAVPKRIVIDILMKLDSPTPDQVANLCESLLVGVVVTREEDDVLSIDFKKTMPPEFFDAQP